MNANTGRARTPGRPALAALYVLCGEGRESGCGRLVRPPGSVMADHPGTKMWGGRIAGKAHCSTCYQREWRAGRHLEPGALGQAVAEAATELEERVAATVARHVPREDWGQVIGMLGLAGKVSRDTADRHLRALGQVAS